MRLSPHLAYTKPVTLQNPTSFGMRLKVTWGEPLPQHLPAMIYTSVAASTALTAISTDEGFVLRWASGRVDPPDDQEHLENAWQALVSHYPALTTCKTDYRSSY
jgi:hypothetical protein